MKKFLMIVVFIVLACQIVYADSLKWDVNPDADYYVVSWGELPGNYTENSQQIIGNEFDIGQLHCKYKYFAVKAYNECGNSSDFSDELMYEEIIEKPVNMIIERSGVKVTVIVEPGV